MATRITVEYEDGRVVETKAKACDNLKVEQAPGGNQYLKNDRPIEFGYRVALEALKRTGNEPPGTEFDEWMDRVDDIDVDESKSRPTSEAPSPDTSSS